MQLPVPDTAPVKLAPETFLITNLAPGAPGEFIPVNAMLIRGEEPIIVDTGAPVHRELWLEQVFSLVEPKDVRWIFLSHDDGDHTGGLMDALAMCPSATLVTNFFSIERLGLEEKVVALERTIWRQPGDSFQAGDRTLSLVLPPVFDGPTTRGLYDESTGVLWAVDSFASATPGAVHHVEDIPAEMYDESFSLFNSLVSPWHQWLDSYLYDRHVDTIEGLHPGVVASAHGPVLTGGAIHDAFDRVRGMAGKPRIMGPDQNALDEMLAAVTAA